MIDLSLFFDYIKFDVYELVSFFSPSTAADFGKNFADWSRQIRRLRLNISENRDGVWDLAVKYGGSGAPHRVYGWLAAGIFYEYFEHLGKDLSYEELRDHIPRLLKDAALLIDEKFLWDERHEEEKAVILTLIERRLTAMLTALRPSPLPEIPEGLEKYRRAIIGSSLKMERVLRRAAKAAPFKVNVLITGETGVGKELIAALIHQMSPRAQKPFVAVNCAAISPYLFEAELFGHQKGAFTGAVTLKRGMVEAAHRGTLFLDEIGDLSLDHQSKILRFLQEGEFQRVGGTETARADVRIIAATHRNLREDIRAGRFREDLYYRLATVSLHVPPLRERPGDIPELVEHMLKNFCRAESIHGRRVTPEAMACLRKYSWPGNVRELKNVIEEAAVMCDPPSIGVSDLPSHVLGSSQTGAYSVEAAEAYLNMFTLGYEGESHFLDIKGLARTIKTTLSPLLKKSFFRAAVEFLMQSRGLSFRLKELVEFFAQRNIGTQQSRVKLAQQALVECGLVYDNGGRTKKHRLRISTRFLLSPFNKMVSKLDKALLEEGFAPNDRFLFEDFVLQHGGQAFSAESLKRYIGSRTWDIESAVKKNSLFLIHPILRTIASILVG
jgi:DNA-binding NtrC family response regulator